MEKLLCPYCDHEIKKAGRCGTCGSRVRNPVKVQTSAVFDSKPSAQPGECDCDVHSPKQGGGASRVGQENWQSRGNQQSQTSWQTQANQQAKGSQQAQANQRNQANQQPQANQRNQASRQAPQKPVKNSYSPFLEHIKNLPTVTKIVLIYVLINLVIAFINFVLMAY